VRDAGALLISVATGLLCYVSRLPMSAESAERRAGLTLRYASERGYRHFTMSFCGARDGPLSSTWSSASRRASWCWRQPRQNVFRRTRVVGLEPEHGQEVEVGRLAKAMLQHQVLVRAIEGFFGDVRVSGCGHADSAGRAPFATEVSDAAVPNRDPACMLSMALADSDPRSLDAV
jgi:hypothetical protein